MAKKNILSIVVLLIVVSLLLCGCEQQETSSPQKQPTEITLPTRESKIPITAVKITPQADVSPPKSLSSEYQQPVPLLAPINTAGAEDSPFILPDGNTLYFFFTPDVKVPVEKQLLDRVTGIYTSKKQNGKWSEPERVILQDKNKLSLEGCEFVQDNKIWFCSAREGYEGIHWFTAEFKNSKWQNWKNADFKQDYKVGELHFTKDGNTVYFHSERPGGKGGLDLWTSTKVNNIWQEPINLETVNTASSEGWPALNPDETELWLYKDYGLWRSKKINNAWSKPELMISPLAGEASIDNVGNVYFVHHYYKDNQMLEADIYLAQKK